MKKLIKFLVTIIFVGGLTFLFTANNFAFWGFTAKKDSLRHQSIVNSAISNNSTCTTYKLSHSTITAGGGDKIKETDTIQFSFTSTSESNFEFELIYENKSEEDDIKLFVKDDMVYAEINNSKQPAEAFNNGTSGLFTQYVPDDFTTVAASLLFGALKAPDAKASTKPTASFKPFYIGTKTSFTTELGDDKQTISYDVSLLNNLKAITITTKTTNVTITSKYTIKKLGTAALTFPDFTSW